MLCWLLLWQDSYARVSDDVKMKYVSVNFDPFKRNDTFKVAFEMQCPFCVQRVHKIFIVVNLYLKNWLFFEPMSILSQNIDESAEKSKDLSQFVLEIFGKYHQHTTHTCFFGNTVHQRNFTYEKKLQIVDGRKWCELNVKALLLSTVI